MSLDDRDLREAWRQREPGRADDCPESDALWQAARGELPPERARELAEHAAGCPACAEAWRLARGLGDEGASSDAAAGAGAAAPTRDPMNAWRPVAAVAAILLLAIAGWSVFRSMSPGGSHGTAPVVREATAEVRSSLEEDAALPRDAFVLRWEGAPPDSIYSVEIGTPDLQSLDRASGLTEAEYRVPAERLASVADGGKVAWRIEASLPDGRQVTSVTHVNRVK